MDTPNGLANLVADDLVNIRREPFQYGLNINRGFIGFTYHHEFLSEAIQYFQRFEQLKNVPVSHVFIVTGPDELVEAHIQTGVSRSSISKYLTDSKCATFFRQPKGYYPDLGNRIAASCESKIGSKYGTPLILADAMDNTIVGHVLNKILKNEPEHILNHLLARPNEFICSQLGAYGLNEQVEFAGRGCLAEPIDTIDPQRLFGDTVIFEPGAVMAVS